MVTSKMDMMMMLKLSPLMVKRKGDPEQLSWDWEEYVYTFNVFLEATGQIPAHADPEVPDTPCRACKKMRNFMIFIGSAEVKMLFDHVGNVTETDNWPRILEKILNGIRGQTNQAMARFKLMQECHKMKNVLQSGICMSEIRQGDAPGQGTAQTWQPGMRYCYKQQTVNCSRKYCRRTSTMLIQ